MSGRPACQRASIKLSVDGAEDIVIPSTLVNFSPVTIDAFQKHIMALCRLTLKDPLYECESIFISDREVDLAYLKSILSGILKEVVAGKKPSVPKLIVSVSCYRDHTISIPVLITSSI